MHYQERMPFQRSKKKTDFLVLLDFMLTDMNGKHFIKTLNEMDCIAPFIIMTGFGDEKIAVEMMKLGARDYIIKDPNFIDLLPQKIKKVCDELENERKLALAEDALRKNEESLRSLMESASDFVVYQLIVNEKKLYLADVVFVSPSIIDIVGLRDPYKFDSWFEDIHEDDVKRVVKVMHKALSRGKPFDQMMRVFHNTKNEWRWVHSIANPVFDLSKKPTHFNGLIIDITERKEIEEELKKHRDHLEELVKKRTAELESFSYSVSHDLRAPLRAIDGFSKIMAEKYLDKFDEEGKHILGMIRNNIKMMDQLINDLLALSHLNRKEINLNSVDIKQLVQSIFNELLPGNSRLDLKMQDNNIPLAYADGVMIKQVFVNLLSNAIKFTKYQNYPRIEVGGRINKNENVYFIKDNGVGFDMQYAEKLFHDCTTATLN